MPDDTDDRDDMEQEDSEANLVLALAVEPPELTLQELFGLDDEQIVEVVVRTLARVQIEEAVEISVLVSNDENLRTLNRDYRGLDNSTDVLSFPAQDMPLVSAPSDELWEHLGDEEEEADDYASGPNGATPGSGAAQAAANALDADAEHIGDELDESNETFEDFDEDLAELEESALDLGDIAISYEAVKRQAATAGHAAGWEFCYLLVHGVLHLVGYDDQSEAGYNAMVKLQDAILAETNITK